MKKISFLIFASLIFLLNSCKDEAEVYDGQPYLHFNKGVSGEFSVIQGTGSNTINIDFGTIDALSSTSQVKLVVDPTVSTAVEGTDFQIVNQNTTVEAGQIGGKFQVKLLESGATVAPKVIVFKLQSSSIPNATFDQTYILRYTKLCPFNIAPFSGTYKVVTDTWADYAADDLISVQPGPGPNQFKILANNNAYISNFSTAYMLVTVQTNGSVTVASNEAFNYGGSTGLLSVSGSGNVNFCTGAIDISNLNFSGASGTSNGNKFVLVKN
ncbi:DUF4843 domain-containing protein [Chryseobacterium sp. 3008163]|uniref:DUF4843 domain-containing protein n=1 Tax=Chryseobacterium sp. 3008163 TaxID=2478663 RepID=UPI000F0C5C5C|nr:DUF4843 domain-containing protein [Chryseobacterium sp. 3008163]AYN00481.1 DUF4843 domain-containing protein [Chryseobacterium sp. 3008163]